MTDLQATLDAIDQVAVHECGHCRRPLAVDGPSADFCGPWCQSEWLRVKQEVVELVGYREPYDLPQHVDNLVELSSSEVTPPVQWPTGGWTTDLTARFMLNTEPFRQSLEAAVSSLGDFMTRYQAQIEQASEQVRRFGDAYFRVLDEEVTDDGIRLIHDVEWIRGPSAPWTLVDEIQLWQPLGIDPLRAVSFGYREEPEPEPCETPELFGADFDFEHRPATTLPDEPPLAVMPALPERDWQALVDARASSGPEQRPRAPRQLGRRTP